MPDTESRIVLGLETAIDGGSISLLDGVDEIAFSAGKSEISKSEELLQLLDELLNKNKIKKKDLGLITVSNGPGSFTGIRIGLASAKGMSDALNIECREVSVLEALVWKAINSKNVITAVFLGRGEVSFQEFSTGGSQLFYSKSKAEICKLSEFADKLGHWTSLDNFTVVFPESLWNLLREDSAVQYLSKPNIEIVKENLAKFIGLQGSLSNASDNQNEKYNKKMKK